ncbi:MAG TPA: F0F1 ATP synthase subunit beta, partial [Patescibacteria group bacterium]|nr:F0F1 ATP synthase subunit beta [Patescibacteria group bacterium]
MKQKSEKINKHTGVIVQIQGVVVDVQFEVGFVPAIYEALTVGSEFTSSKTLVLEVEQHLGDNRVRTVALGPTDGLRRGLSVSATGAPISVPVGKKTLGRIFNVVGEPIDEGAAVTGAKLHPIHRHAPTLASQSTKRE